MELKNKTTILLLISLLLSNNAYSNSGYQSRYEQRQCQIKQRQQEQMYPYSQYTDGIQTLNEYNGVQKCLKWLTRASFCHPNRSPRIEEALYHIGIAGRAINNYASEDYSPEKKGIPSLEKINSIQKMIKKGKDYIEFCSRLPNPPRIISN